MYNSKALKKHIMENMVTISQLSSKMNSFLVLRFWNTSFIFPHLTSWNEILHKLKHIPLSTIHSD